MKKRIVITLISIAAISIGFGALFYVSLSSKSLQGEVHSPEISCRNAIRIEDFTARYAPTLSHSLTFKLACTIKRFHSVKPGNYRLEPGMSNAQIIHHLRSGGNPVVKLRLDKAADIYDVAGLLGNALRYDSVEFISAFMDKPMLDSLQTDTANLVGLFLPNTYEFYWNMSPASFIQRMMKEQRLFWTEERRMRAEAQELSPREIIILASIVKAETGAIQEAPIIAGLYLNRLRAGIPLQSDPTAIFGTRSGAQRVYLSDIRSDNPYNTYKFKGLPPGPINLPEAEYIDAVLNASLHRYIYMCAQPGGTGKHNFAISLQEHERNRSEYIRWLNANKIK